MVAVAETAAGTAMEWSAAEAEGQKEFDKFTKESAVNQAQLKKDVEHKEKKKTEEAEKDSKKAALRASTAGPVIATPVAINVEVKSDDKPGWSRTGVGGSSSAADPFPSRGVEMKSEDKGAPAAGWSWTGNSNAADPYPKALQLTAVEDGRIEPHLFEVPGHAVA